MNKLISTSLIALLLFAVSIQSQAQRNNWNGPLSFGVSSGAAVYKGDLSDANANPWLPFSKDVNFSMAGFFAKELGPFNLRFQMTLGGLKGYDFRADERFSNNFYEYNGIVTVNINHLIKLNNYENPGYNFYFLAGYGMLRYSSYLTDISQFTLLEEIGYAKIGRANSMIGGAGVKINVVDKVNFLAEFTYHITNNDDLDAKIENGDNDNFYYVSVGITYDLLGNSKGSSSRSRKSLRWGRF
ncbi:MAG: hypothetical protein JW729_08935 [Bacteroidales bacterium]|nr:hypothetical protein [Bacteroidales bacterium]